MPTAEHDGGRGLASEEESETQSAESQQTISMSTEQLEEEEATTSTAKSKSRSSKHKRARHNTSEGVGGKDAQNGQNRAATNERATTSDRIAPDSDDETHQEKFNRVQKARETYISLPPGEMIKARGEKLLVIQPGSQVLRIGLAGEPDFVEIPNCVAHRKKKRSRSSMATKESKGEARINDESASRAGCSQIENLLSFGKGGKGGRSMEQPVLTLMKEEETKKTKKEKEEEPSEATHLAEGGEEVATLFGSQALEGAKSGEFDLHFCMQNGHLHDNVTPVNTLKRHLHDIWWWVIRTHLKIDKKEDLACYSCLLLVSSVMHKTEARDMVDVVLRDLGMQEIAIHRDSVASMFTHGCQVACVVNVDTHFTSVVCIEDGTYVPNSKIILPYGRWDVLHLTRSLLRKHDCWPYSTSKEQEEEKKDNKDNDWIAGFTCVDEFEALGEIFTKCCKYVAAEEDNATAKSSAAAASSKKLKKKERTSVTLTAGKGQTVSKSKSKEEEDDENTTGTEKKVYRLEPGYASLVAPMALYVPQAFGLSKFEKEGRRRDHLTMANFQDSVNGVLLDSIAQHPNNSSLKRLKQQSDPGGSRSESEGERGAVLGIDQAIVKSILSTSRPDLKHRLFQNIVLVGDYACELPGCMDALEARVLLCLPQEEPEVNTNANTNTVNVVHPKVVDPRETIFRGGALLGVLDWVQENWIQRKEWVSGGVHVGLAKKLSRINKLSLQLLWNGVY